MYAWSLLPVQLLQIALQGTNCSIQRFPSQWNYNLSPPSNNFLSFPQVEESVILFNGFLNLSSTACDILQKHKHNFCSNIAPSFISILILKHPCSTRADLIQQIFPLPQSSRFFSPAIQCRSPDVVLVSLAFKKFKVSKPLFSLSL